jgi:hypothetical protein
MAHRVWTGPPQRPLLLDEDVSALDNVMGSPLSPAAAREWTLTRSPWAGRAARR